MANAKNVLGEPLQLCCGNTGYTREGFCYVPDTDFGNHSICAIMTDALTEASEKLKQSFGDDIVYWSYRATDMGGCQEHPSDAQQNIIANELVALITETQL